MGDLANSVERSIEAMSWKTVADKGAIQLARTYAAQIEAGVSEGGQDATKALYLGPHLLKCLAELGGTPTGRKALELKEGPSGSLANLRSLRGGKSEPKGGKSA